MTTNEKTSNILFETVKRGKTDFKELAKIMKVVAIWGSETEEDTIKLRKGIIYDNYYKRK